MKDAFPFKIRYKFILNIKCLLPGSVLILHVHFAVVVSVCVNKASCTTLPGCRRARLLASAYIFAFCVDAVMHVPLLHGVWSKQDSLGIVVMCVILSLFLLLTPFSNIYYFNFYINIDNSSYLKN
jgi:hypothetical protein